MFFDFIDDETRRIGTGRVRKVAILHENNDLFGNGGAAATKKLAKRRGIAFREFTYGTVLGSSESLSDPSCTLEEYNLVGTLRRRVRQIKQYNPDVVFAIGYAPDAITAVQTMKKLQYTPPALLGFGGGFINSSFIPGVRTGNPVCRLPGADPAGIIARASWSPDSSSQRQTARRIAALFQLRYKRPMTAQAAQGFTAMLTLARAINDAGSTDPEKIQAALRALDLPANATIMPWSGVKFDAYGQNTRAQFVLQQIIGGHYRVVYPPGPATAEAIWPLANARKK
jgi:branched-chain amino acid transport system substrate-binding protein